MALLADRKQLDLVAELLQVQSRLVGVVHTVLDPGRPFRGGYDRSWCSDSVVVGVKLRYTRGQASAMLHHANDLHRFSQLGDALRDGRANERQAQAVTQVLKKLTQISVLNRRGATVDQGSARSSTATGSLACPGTCWRLSHPRSPKKPKRNGRNVNCAMQEQARHLNFADDGHGSTTIKGSLPTADAALLKAQIKALGQAGWRSASPGTTRPWCAATVVAATPR